MHSGGRGSGCHDRWIVLVGGMVGAAVGPAEGDVDVEGEVEGAPVSGNLTTEELMYCYLVVRRVKCHGV